MKEPMTIAEKSLALHEEWKGKIEMKSRVPVKTKEDLALAYTPGVAQPCLEIQKDVSKSFVYTRVFDTSVIKKVPLSLVIGLFFCQLFCFTI